jgi:hypothetical protein
MIVTRLLAGGTTVDFRRNGDAIGDIVDEHQRAPKYVLGTPVNEKPPKYFVKRGTPAGARATSVLSGEDDGPLFEASAAKSRARASRLSEATARREGFGDLVEISHPVRSPNDIILNGDSTFTLLGIANEFRRGDEIRRHGLRLRSKMLFCGPPGCGKSLCAEVVASELQMPLVILRLDAAIASHLGETAGNLRKVFDAARTRSMVLFLDEFDALARARNDTSDHNEIRRVVNSLLMMIDRFDGNSILIAATNLEQTVDRAIWRRFDEVVVFDKPTIAQIRRLLKIKTRNFPAEFDIVRFADQFVGMSFAQIERACLSAIRSSILAHKSSIPENVFKTILEHEVRRSKVESKILQ